MSTASRKQRESQEREEKFLDASRPMLVDDGYHGLNKFRIAKSLQYCKGTIYSHFSCKEEIIIALAIQTREERTDCFAGQRHFTAVRASGCPPSASRPSNS